jgi:hypothetical protein
VAQPQCQQYQSTQDEIELCLARLDEEERLYNRLADEFDRRGLDNYAPPVAPNLAQTPDHALQQQIDDLDANLGPLLALPPGVDFEALTEADLRNRMDDCWVFAALLDSYVSRLKTGQPARERIIASEYAKARGDLVSAFGQYCAYCELPGPANLAVEHMLPKDSFAAFAADWDNFLLTCAACNSRKLNNPSFAAFDDHSGLAGVAARAHASMLFPTDPDYDLGGFTASFAYTMRRVARSGIDLLFDENVDERALYDGIPRPVELIGSSPSGVVVRLYHTVHQAMLTAADVQGLADMALTGAPIPAANIPAELKTGWGAPAAVGTCTIAPGVRNDAAELDFTISHAVTYEFDLTAVTGNLRIVPPAPMPAISPNLPAYRATPWLLHDVLPGNLLCGQAGLGYEFLPAIAATVSPNAGVTADRFDVILTSTYRCHLDKATGELTVLTYEDTPAELLITDAQPAAAAPLRDRAAETLKLLDLNDAKIAERPVVLDEGRRRKGGKAKDVNTIVYRRVAWRTRTWFAATASIKRLRRAQVLRAAGNCTDAARAALTSAIAETMKATGCWGVWCHVCAQVPPGALRDTLADLLRRQDVFPGTRI